MMFVSQSSSSWAMVFRRSLLLLCCWVMVAVAMAQSFSLSHSMKPGVCFADAELTAIVTPENMPAGTKYSYILYNLTVDINGKPVDGKPVIKADLTHTYTELTAGKYRIEVVSQGSLVLKQSIEVDVTTTYTPPTVALNRLQSREAYVCGSGTGTGKIVLDITGGRGNKVIKIAQGPMREGETIPFTKSDNAYTLEGTNWLPGTYIINVVDPDACDYSTSYQFEILQLTELPKLGDESRVMATSVEDDCNKVIGNWIRISQSTETALLKYYNAGLYEMGLQLPDQSEADVEFRVFDSNHKYSARWSNTVYELVRRYGMYNIPVNLIMRLKQCPDVKRIIPLTMYLQHYLGFEQGQGCSPLSASFYLSSGTHLCFPVQMEVYEVDPSGAKTLLTTKTLTKINERQSVDFPTRPQMLKSEGQNILWKLTDANGNVVEHNGSIALYASLDKTNFQCDYYSAQLSYNLTINAGNGFRPNSLKCGISDVKLYDWNGTNFISDVSQNPAPNEHIFSHNLEYGKGYTFKYKVNGVDAESKVPITSLPPIQIIRVSSSPSEYAMNTTRFNVTFNSTTVLQGSEITIEGPNGFKATELTPYDVFYNPGISNYTVVLKNYYTNLTPGEYTFTVRNKCDGATSSYKFNYKGAYNVTDFSYDIKYRCGEAYITPKARVTYEGKTLSTNEYSFFIYPNGNYVEEIIAPPGQPIRVSKEGTYKVGVVIIPASINYTIVKSGQNFPDNEDYALTSLANAFPVSYQTPALTIDNTRTVSFVCGPSATGNIYVQAKGGVAPYTYELYATAADRDSRQNMLLPAYTGNEAAHFEYGQMGETYYILVRDACLGSSFKYSTTLINVSELSLAYAEPASVCVDDIVHLRMAMPEKLKENSQVAWYYYNRELIDEPEFEFRASDVSMSGPYEVRFKLQNCDIEVSNIVNVSVAPNLHFNTPLPPIKYTACVGSELTVIGPTSAGASSYQWELATQRRLNPDFALGASLQEYIYTWGGTGTLVGNTSQINYTTRFMKAGIYGLRSALSNPSCMVYGEPITVVVKACTVPVNPHLMHRPIVNWNVFNATPTPLAP